MKDAGLRPLLRVLEEVDPSENVWERENRWMSHYIHSDAQLTNYEVSWRPHLADAVRATALDYLKEPIDSAAWRPLYDALQQDLRARHLKHQKGGGNLARPPCALCDSRKCPVPTTGGWWERRPGRTSIFHPFTESAETGSDE